MAAITSAVIVAGGAAVAANQQKKAAQGAANAQTNATNATIEEQRRQFDLTRSDNLPFLQSGQQALGGLQQLDSGDFSGFDQSPDFLFAQQQGTQGLDRSAAARGGLFSGGHTADTLRFNQGLASQQLGAFRNSLQARAGLGQSTGLALGQFGAGMANGIGNALQNNANAQRQSSFARSDANGQLAGAAFGAFGNALANNSARNGGGSGFFFGNNPGKG